MNDVYGIDPAAPSDFRDFATLMRLFEIDQGRFITDYPRGGWFINLKQHLDSLSLSAPDQLRAVELWLKVGQSALVPVEQKFNPAHSWPENAIKIQGKVKALLGAANCPATLVPLSEYLSDPNGFPDARGAHIHRTPNDYVKVARPLLQTSPKVVLVDPYFKLRYLDRNSGKFRAARFCKVLDALLREAVYWGRVEVFKLAISPKEAFLEDPEGKIFSDELLALVDKAGAASIKIETEQLDPSKPIGNHARYLLGMKRGLHFDWGFDTADIGPTNHVEWISRSALQPLLQRFT
jgi:hypothetical protein